MTITLGIFCGLFLHIFDAKGVESTIKTTFEPIFMLILLPPILYASALKMNKFFFFKNFGTILLYAFIGTGIAISVNTMLMYSFNFLGIGLFIPLHQCFIFSTIISATDPVSVLVTFEGFQADQNLYSLIFGESILNDAISLGIYRSIMVDNNEESKVKFFTDTSVQFIAITISSTLLGIAIGLFAAFLLKKINYWTTITERQIDLMSTVLDITNWEELEDKEQNHSQIDKDTLDIVSDETAAPLNLKANKPLTDSHQNEDSDSLLNQEENRSIQDEEATTLEDKASIQYKTQFYIFKRIVSNFNQYMTQELSVILISPLLAYLIAESFDYSGIISILFCGITISRYAVHNLNRRNYKLMMKLCLTISETFETFAFLVIGVSLFGFTYSSVNIGYPQLMANFLFLIISRFFNIQTVSYIVNKMRIKNINNNFKSIMMLSGLRGAMAFAIAITNSTQEFDGRTWKAQLKKCTYVCAPSFARKNL